MHDHGHSNNGIKLLRKQRMFRRKGESSLENLNGWQITGARRRIVYDSDLFACGPPEFLQHAGGSISSNDPKTTLRQEDRIPATPAPDFQNTGAGWQMLQKDSLQF